MADTPPENATGAKPGASNEAGRAVPPKGNPALRMMGMPSIPVSLLWTIQLIILSCAGLPNIRAKLPSRNWMIFFGVVGTWTGLWYYDRREKKRIQQEWCNAVAHLASEPLPTNRMQRKVTIVLGAPPGDGLMAAREHFHEYVKPVLVAAALDWDVIEGRKQDDVRAELAEKIRKRRKMNGERTAEPLDEGDSEVVIKDLRERAGVTDSDDVAGDIVIGRHTWKEYVRGLHEGWLGPLDPPRGSSESHTSTATQSTGTPDDGSSPTPSSALTSDVKDSVSLTPESNPDTPTSSDAQSNASPTESSTTPAPSPENTAESEKPKKPKRPPPFIYPSDYPVERLAPLCPVEFGPSTAIPYPHIIGLRHTFTRIYRFLTQRHLADDIGRRVAAVALGANAPYETYERSGASQPSALADDASPSSSSYTEIGADQREWEQQRVLAHEEQEWHKSIRKRPEGEKESVWLDPMVLDPRVAERMKKFVLPEGVGKDVNDPDS